MPGIWVTKLAIPLEKRNVVIINDKFGTRAARGILTSDQRNDASQWYYWMIASLLSSASRLFLIRPAGHFFPSMDAWTLRAGADGRMRWTELPFSSPTFFATAMARRDNAFSISINSAWRPTSTSTTDGFGRAKCKYILGVKYLQRSCGVVRYWKRILYRVGFYSKAYIFCYKVGGQAFY